MNPDSPSEPRGSRVGNTLPKDSIAGYTPPILTKPGDQPIYRGHRDQTATVSEDCAVRVDGESLDKRYDLLSASPSGFERGYGGSGPAQLAIAILADAYDDETACKHYQRFTNEIVSELPEDSWAVTKADLDAWIAEVADV